MAGTADDLIWTLAESDEVDIETRRDSQSPLHRTTIWIVPTRDGVYIRSVKGKKGRWYQEAVANPHVTLRVGERKVAARVEQEQSQAVISEVSAAYRQKYGERWPNDTESMVQHPVLPTTLRVTAA
jgi:hypothetical protein